VRDVGILKKDLDVGQYESERSGNAGKLTIFSKEFEQEIFGSSLFYTCSVQPDVTSEPATDALKVEVTLSDPCFAGQEDHFSEEGQRPSHGELRP
jgi:hypothetical protein